MGSVGQVRASDLPASAYVRIRQECEEAGKAMKSEPLGRKSRTDAQRAELALASPSCAYEDINPQACPLRDIRDKGLRDRMAWLDAASDEAIQNNYFYSRICWEAKEKLGQQDRTKPGPAGT